MFPRDKTADGLPADNSYDPRKTPTEAHAQFMWASEASFFTPAMFGLSRRRVGAGFEKGTDETLDRGGGDIKSEGGENEGSCEATSAKFDGNDIHEACHVVKTKDDMTLVREIAIIVFQGLFVAGFIAGPIKIERKKASVWYLSNEVSYIVLLSGRAQGARPGLCVVGVFLLLLSSVLFR